MGHLYKSDDKDIYFYKYKKYSYILGNIYKQEKNTADAVNCFFQVLFIEPKDKYKDEYNEECK